MVKPAYGLAKINAATGAVMPWNATVEVRNAGVNAGVTSLRVANGNVYGTTYHFGSGGNLEGPFAVSADTGDLTWAADCHGDTYSSAESNGAVYVVGHSHYCGNVGGGFPQTTTWGYQRALGVHGRRHGDEPARTARLSEGLVREAEPVDRPLDAARSLPGTYTGQGQGAWSVAATDEYVVLGGEFPTVNGTAQQGLVRFGRSSVAPNAQKPIFAGGTWVPTLGADVDDLRPCQLEDGAGPRRPGPHLQGDPRQRLGQPGVPDDDRLELVEPPGGRLRGHRTDAWRDLPLPDRASTTRRGTPCSATRRSSRCRRRGRRPPHATQVLADNLRSTGR